MDKDNVIDLNEERARRGLPPVPSPQEPDEPTPLYCHYAPPRWLRAMPAEIFDFHYGAFVLRGSMDRKDLSRTALRRAANLLEEAALAVRHGGMLYAKY